MVLDPWHRSERPGEPGEDNAVHLGVDLVADRIGVGYRAKKNSNLLDLSRRNHYDPADYWEQVVAERTNRVVLEPEEFYLLTAVERVRVPPEYAVEMTAYDPSSGELRTHYAGFFDPGFGYSDDARMAGAQTVMEVRAHDVPFMIEHGQKVCTLTYERMMEPPDKIVRGQHRVLVPGRRLGVERPLQAGIRLPATAPDHVRRRAVVTFYPLQTSCIPVSTCPALLEK